MVPAILSAAVVLLAPGPVYEGVARDGFAAWSFTTGSMTITGNLTTTSVMARYASPVPFNGNPTPIAYSTHPVTFDCAARTAAFGVGSNYSASGVPVAAGTASPAAPWTDFTSGFQSLASQVCAMKGQL